MKLSNRELGTVLAALRYWQKDIIEAYGIYPNEDLMMIATDDHSFNPLTTEEIDELCEKINQ